MNKENKIETFFDSPERLPNEEILKEILRLKQNSLINQLLEGYPELAVLINQNRQIVAFNSKALKAFGTDDYFEIVGKRVGEALNCVHSTDTIAGCGTTKFCSECGAAKAIKKTIDMNTQANEECRITVGQEEKHISLDFNVNTQPLHFDNNHYTIFAVRDISGEKRRDTLEKIFFHDVLNTAGALKGLTQILPEIETDGERQEIVDAINYSAIQLINEITAQRELRNAEDGNLATNFSSVSINEILMHIYDLYYNHELAHERDIQIEKTVDYVTFTTDTTLLIRALGNLVKNALEASPKRSDIKIWASTSDEVVTFSVRNLGFIPKNIQVQLFKRSFSTKGQKGRGVGLYSVKLIVEQFLNGEITFSTDEVEGTVFSITLPKSIS